MVKSAYIHIPFCNSKCHYCSFVSFVRPDLKKDYLKILAKEIKFFYNHETLDTLYIGGGTPSILTPLEIENIIRLFNINTNTEVTIEVNPECGSYDFFRGIFDAGVNRISLGCQTFNDRTLKLINRHHNAGQVIDSVKTAQDAGFKNISLDLIYGLPNQRNEDFLKDIELAIPLGIRHISLYGLKIETGCYFYSDLPANLPDDDIQADMYLSAVEFLTGKKFEQYEVSSFSKHGFNSRHNTAYWNNEEYYGFGIGAHGYQNGIRYANSDTIETYLADFTLKKESKILTQKEIMEEEIFLGFRKSCGINVYAINSKFGIDFEDKYNSVLAKYINLNLIKKTKKGYKLTLRGILVSNVVLSDFIN